MPWLKQPAYSEKHLVTNLASKAQIIADNSNPTNPATFALDGNLDSWWEAAPGKTNDHTYTYFA